MDILELGPSTQPHLILGYGCVQVHVTADISVVSIHD